MSDLWTVWIEHDEPEYPEGIQRTGRRRVMIVSARGMDERIAMVRGERIAQGKGCKNCVAVKAQRMGGEG